MGWAKSVNKSCPTWLNDPSVPVCPDGTLVPENYPMSMMVISDAKIDGKSESELYANKFVRDVVSETLLSSGNRPPRIVMPVSAKTYQDVVDMVKLMDIPPATRDQYLAALVHAPDAPAGLWQQDYQQPFIDAATGAPQVRFLDYSFGMGFVTEEKAVNLQKIYAECGVRGGDALTAPRKPDGRLPSGAKGGNIEGIPGNICAVGDATFSFEQWTTFTDQVCTGTKLLVPTKWLKVGHTDEVMKVVKDTKSPPPCDYAIQLASPRKALEVLKKSPDDSFLDVGGTSSASGAKRLIQKTDGLSGLCLEFIKDRRSRPAAPAGPREAPATSQWIQLLFPQARASLSEGILDACVAMTNADVARLLETDGRLKQFNDLVQTKMNQLKVAIHGSVQFTGCDPRVIQVPNLFFGNAPIEKDGKFELANQSGLSILPNPTNSISNGSSVIYPRQINQAFTRELKDVSSSLGVTARFVDSAFAAHPGDGNIHCRTMTMHACRPRGSK